MPDPAEMVRNLKAQDPGVRLHAAQWIAKQAQQESSRVNQGWMGKRDTTGPLIEALDDPDPQVVEKAVFTLAIIAIRYFKDARAYPGVLRLLQSKRQTTRMWAAELAAALRGKRSLEDILPLTEDPAPKVRAKALLLCRDLAIRKPISAVHQDRLRQLGLAALQDEDSQVRDRGASLLRELGDPTVLKQLEKALAREPDPLVKETMQYDIDELKKRS